MTYIYELLVIFFRDIGGSNNGNSVEQSDPHALNGVNDCGSMRDRENVLSDRSQVLDGVGCDCLELRIVFLQEPQDVHLSEHSVGGCAFDELDAGDVVHVAV